MPEIPLWVKRPDYDRVDWLNKFILHMWPFIDKASHSIIRSTAELIFAEYIGKYKIESIEFENLSLGNLPPIIHATGTYGAIRAKTVAPHLEVIVIKKGKPLSKVKISGGGRCNVTDGHCAENVETTQEVIKNCEDPFSICIVQWILCHGFLIVEWN